MIFLGLLGGYLTLLGGGFGIMLLLRRGILRINLAECCCLSWLFGMGAVSLLLWVFGFLISGSALSALVTLCCLILAITGWNRAVRSGTRFFLPRPANLFEWLMLVLVACQIAIVLLLSLNRPLGWDGLLMWEAKARFAFLSGNVLPQHYYVSGRSLTHPEYPLGIPFTELWLYIWMGEPHQFLIKTVFATFYACGVGLLGIVSARLTGKRWIGYVIAALFFFVPHEIVRPGGVTFGYVDFPMSVVYLAAVGYLLLFLQSDSKYDFRIYVTALALLPWLKREGLILWVIAALAGAAVLFVRKKPRVWLFAFLPGALIGLAWTLYLRAVHVQASQEFFPVSWRMVLENGGRLLVTWRTMLAEMANPQTWGMFWLMAAVALIYLLCSIRKLWVAVLLWSALIPVLAYTSIYIFSTTIDYVVHIKLSLSRLLMQVVPVFWLAIAAALAMPWKAKRPLAAPLADLDGL